MIKTASIIGSGNVATHLAQALFNAGVEIKNIYSPTLANCSALAKRVSATPVTSITDLTDDVDIIFISVKDDAIKTVVEQLIGYKGIVVHTSGGVTIDIFNEKFERCGVFYPLQTFSKTNEIDFTEVPLFLEAADNDTYLQIEELAKLLSKVVMPATSEKRKVLHIAAVFACNFVNHCYDIAFRVLEKDGIPFSTLLPLIKETTKKIETTTPYNAQTGPARRGDETVMSGHLKSIDDSHVAELYTMLSKSILERYK